MKRQFIIIFKLILIITTNTHEYPSIDLAIGDIHMYFNIINDFKNVSHSHIILNAQNQKSNEYASKLSLLDVINSKIKPLCDKYNEIFTIDNNQNNVKPIWDSMMNQIPFTSNLHILIAGLGNYMNYIDVLYNKHFIHHITTVHTLDDFPSLNLFINETILWHKKNILVYKHEEIYEYLILIDENPASFLRYINNYPVNFVEEIEENPNYILDKIDQTISDRQISFDATCIFNMSIQQYLYQIYKIFVVTETRLFIMNIFSLMYRSAIDNVSYNKEIKISSTKFILRIQEYIHAAKRAMKISRKTYQSCKFKTTMQNLKNFQPSEILHELDGSIQMFIAHEPDLFKTGTCDNTCEDIQYSSVYGCINSTGWCPHRTCHGVINNCKNIGSVNICTKDEQSLKRYDWVIESQNVNSDIECNGTRQTIGPGRRYLSYPCEVCMCECYENDGNSQSIRTLNLRPQVSNINENMVVTGIRFISADKMIQIQIAEGKLLPRGRIDENNNQWIEPEKFLYDSSLHLTGGFHLLHKNNTKTPLKAHNNYAHIDFLDRTLDLDDITVPLGYVITGVKLRSEENDWGESHIQLEIRATKFDFHTGTLATEPGTTIWITPYTQPTPPNYYKRERGLLPVNDIHKERCSWSKVWKMVSKIRGFHESANDHLDIDDSDIPECSRTIIWRSNPNTYIEFQSSSFEADAGQSTIPYFDSGNTNRSVNTALSGIELFYQTVPWWGGVISFKTKDIDYSEYMQTMSHNDWMEFIKEIRQRST